MKTKFLFDNSHVSQTIDALMNAGAFSSLIKVAFTHQMIFDKSIDADDFIVAYETLVRSLPTIRTTFKTRARIQRRQYHMLSTDRHVALTCLLPMLLVSVNFYLHIADGSLMPTIVAHK